MKILMFGLQLVKKNNLNKYLTNVSKLKYYHEALILLMIYFHSTCTGADLNQSDPFCNKNTYYSGIHIDNLSDKYAK